MGTTSQKKPCKNCGPQPPQAPGAPKSSRQKANRELVKILHAYVEAQPDVRFSQLLRNLDMVEEDRGKDGLVLGWKNEFYREPEDILKRVKLALQKEQG